MIFLTKLAREFNLTFCLLVPPSISNILVIIVSFLILIPTLSIIIFTLLSITSRLLVTLLVRRLHREYTLFGRVGMKS